MVTDKIRKVKLTREEITWVERSADFETARLFQNFDEILKVYKEATKEQRELLDKQIDELIRLYTFLKTIRAKLELWDCRYDIDTEIEYPNEEKK